MATVYEVARALYHDEPATVGLLLTAGFEPFAVDEGRMYFKRATDIQRTGEEVAYDEEMVGFIARDKGTPSPEEGE